MSDVGVEQGIAIDKSGDRELRVDVFCSIRQASPVLAVLFMPGWV